MYQTLSRFQTSDTNVCIFYWGGEIGIRTRPKQLSDHLFPPLWICICYSLRDSCSYGDRQQADTTPQIFTPRRNDTLPLSIHQPSHHPGSFLFALTCFLMSKSVLSMPGSPILGASFPTSLLRTYKVNTL